MTTTAPTPILIKRERNLGWLAATPPSWPTQFAVIAESEAAAAEQFAETAVRWESLVGDAHA